MNIGHVLRSSVIEYPGKVCAVVFTTGCNFRCPFCHNPELVDPSLFGESYSQEELFAFLARRVGKLDAVSVTGGEPCLQPGLIPFLRRVREMGFLVKLDTNGSLPEVLAQVVNEGLADYLAMDIKAPLDKYASVAGKTVDTAMIGQSVRMILGSKVAHEFRTTLVDSLLRPRDVLEIGAMIKGANRYMLQRFVPSKHLDPAYARAGTFSEEEIAALLKELRLLVGYCAAR